MLAGNAAHNKQSKEKNLFFRAKNFAQEKFDLNDQCY
jgi:hypothetical protein